MSDIPAHGPHPGLVAALQRRERLESMRAKCATDGQALQRFADQHGTTPQAAPPGVSALGERPLGGYLQRVEVLITRAGDLQRRIDANTAAIRELEAVPPPALPRPRSTAALVLGVIAVVAVMAAVAVWMFLR